MFQKDSNWADGAAFVNQCPITTGNSFLYEFSASDQTGTFWYHSHMSTQYCDGLRGALIIYDPDDPHASLYDVDDSGCYLSYVERVILISIFTDTTVISLMDWYHTAAALGDRFP